MGLLKITKVFLEYFVLHKVNKHSKKILGRRIREACEKLGTTYIKFGQMLSTRYDILSEKDCKALQELFDEIKEIPYSKIKEIFKHDLGKYPEEIYEEFNPKPISSASIAQIYRARLKSGEEVAVKVRRPYVGEKIIKDMNLLIRITKFCQFFSPLLKTANAANVAKEMKSWLLQEIDFENEIKNIIETKKHYSFCDGKRYRANLPSGVFLFPYRKFCSKNVITMNYIEGVPINRIDEIRDNPEYDINTSFKSYISAATHALFLNNKGYLFQADPHPANILIMKNGQASSIDCGLMARISSENVEKMKKLFLSVYSGDLDNTIRFALDVCDASRKKYADKVRKDMKDYLLRTPHEGIGFWFMGIIKIFIKYRIKVPYFLSAFGRCNFVLDGCIQSFDKNQNTLAYLQEELRWAMKDEIVNNLKNIKYESLLYNITEKIKNSPEKLNKLLDRYYENPLAVIRDFRSAMV
ncbi:AarF/ABC1/UbiB kinase family protein [Candidatus Woesearchaeota archaeon]|nr:AarF/ABC1/UbiB kinase family protein [Candidatus Woesearchaeota archaeon]